MRVGLILSFSHSVFLHHYKHVNHPKPAKHIRVDLIHNKTEFKRIIKVLFCEQYYFNRLVKKECIFTIFGYLLEEMLVKACMWTNFLGAGALQPSQPQDNLMGRCEITAWR